MLCITKGCTEAAGGGKLQKVVTTWIKRTRSVESSFSINWARPLLDDKAWRWHSKSRSDRYTV